MKSRQDLLDEARKKVREMGIVVPVIFITGSPTDELHDYAKELGVREILIKPQRFW